MKIMVVNNNVMFENEQGFFIFKETGKFFCELKDQGHRVMVFQFSMKFGKSDVLADYNLKDRGLKIVNVKRGKSKLLAYIKALFRGFNTIRKVDFVYLFYPGHICSILAIFCIILGKKYGFYIRGEQNILGKLQAFLYRRAAIILTISPRLTQTVSQFNKHTNTIRPMIGFSETDIVHDRRYPAKSFFNILFVGRVEKDKGAYEIISALTTLINKGYANFKMHFIGDGPDLISLRNKVEEVGHSKFYTFHGTVTERSKLIDFFKTSDLFLLPTHHEGFPRVLYEAMIFGIPIITTFVGMIPFLMKDKYNCFKIDPKNSVDLVDKIEYFITDYPKSSYIAANGTKTIVEYLSDKPDRHSAQLSKYLSKVI